MNEHNWENLFGKQTNMMQSSKLFKSFHRFWEISNTKSKSFMHKQQTLEMSINSIAKQV